MADAREVMNIRQASQYLEFARRSLQVRSEATFPRSTGNRWKFKKSILDSWMENQSLSSEIAPSANWVSHFRTMAGADSRVSEKFHSPPTPLQHSSFF